jgi:hypothetical protein
MIIFKSKKDRNFIKKYKETDHYIYKDLNSISTLNNVLIKYCFNKSIIVKTYSYNGEKENSFFILKFVEHTVPCKSNYLRKIFKIKEKEVTNYPPDMDKLKQDLIKLFSSVGIGNKIDIKIINDNALHYKKQIHFIYLTEDNENKKIKKKELTKNINNF